jgi:hypothetical protein
LKQELCENNQAFLAKTTPGTWDLANILPQLTAHGWPIFTSLPNKYLSRISADPPSKGQKI